MATDLAELVRARLAAKIEAGKRPSKADLEWLAATTESAALSSVEKKRSISKGETEIDVKVYHRDPYEAERISDEIYNRQRAKYPMKDGTVGSPMREVEAA